MRNRRSIRLDGYVGADPRIRPQIEQTQGSARTDNENILILKNVGADPRIRPQIIENI